MDFECVLWSKISVQKSSDQDPHCFPLCLKIHTYNLNAAGQQDENFGVVLYIKNTRGCLLMSSLPGKALRTLVDIAFSKPSLVNLISKAANLVFLHGNS